MNSTECKISSGFSLDMKIYRIFKPEYFFDLIQNKKNTLVIPAKWNDPFENALLKSKFRIQNSDDPTKFHTVGFKFCNDVYAQCWTLNPDSNAMWQIYAPARDGICVQTTVGKLGTDLSSLYCLQPVQYMCEKELLSFLKTVFINSPCNVSKIADSLSAKRKEYEYEHEVRLICTYDSNQNSDGTHRYYINPDHLIERVIIDGRMEEEFYNALKCKIMKNTNLQSFKIKRSTLYDLPKNFVSEID